MYTIKQVSQMFDLPASTLRYYEDMGILTNIERTPGNQRIYTQAHVNRLSAICCFKRAGMSIQRLQQFFAYEADEERYIDDMVELLSVQKQEIEDQLKQLEADYKHIRRKYGYYTDIKKALEAGEMVPEWKDYKDLDI